ncbi:hypothetical protein TNCV_4839711 [Trichonephila clavipes]|nr:hypothetical protein TNCV_4839711 [Trichonephila clavipes]
MKVKVYCAYFSLHAEVHELMFRSGGQSDAKNLQCSILKQAWYSFIDSLKDERLSRPFPVRGLNPGPVMWKRDTLPLSYIDV